MVVLVLLEGVVAEITPEHRGQAMFMRCRESLLGRQPRLAPRVPELDAGDRAMLAIRACVAAFCKSILIDP